MRSVRSSRLRLENLEDRFNPAGTVTGSFSNGTWTLTGDAEANIIYVNPTAKPGKFELVGSATTVSGVTNPTGVTDIVIRLAAGQDSVRFNNTADLAGVLAGGIAVNGGADANIVEIRRFKVGGNVSVVNGLNATGEDEFSVEDSRINGKVTIANGDGGSETGFYRTTTGFNFVGGGVTIVNGAGFDTTAIGDTHVIGDVVVRNGLPDAADNAGQFELFNARNTITRAIVFGNVVVGYRSGTINSDAIFDAEVTGNVTFNHGTGAATTYFDGLSVDLPAVIRGSLTFNGTGPTVVDIGTRELRTGLFVGRDLRITSGEAADNLYLFNLTVCGATEISTGGGADTISVDSSTFRRFQLLTGAGADVVAIETNGGLGTQFFGNVLVGMGADNDGLVVGAEDDPTSRVEFVQSASFFGGAGTDARNLFFYDSLTGVPVVEAFEIVNI